ncbi:MAG: peptidyl-prolyl cis-trans isomerase, partial [Candidatus Omnitrophica bacterium]|nr:peptidyl-prolyl cis-trans isomerase [Candidatus Omnitrophota bacterium]
ISYLRKNEKIAVEYLSKNFKDIEESLQPQDQQLLNYYNSHLQEFKVPPTFNLQYVATDDREKAEIFYKKLKRDKDFLKVALNMNLEVKETGFFSAEEPIPTIGWNIGLVYIIENLKLGQISPPLKIADRYFIIRMKERKSPYLANFQDIKEKIKEIFVKNEARRIAKELMEKVFLKIKEESTDFREISKEFDLNYGTTDLFSRQTYIPQIGSSDKFFLALPELKVGTLSKGIIEMEQAIFIIRVKEYAGIDEETYQKEKEEFSKEITFRLKNSRFLEFLLSLRDKAKIYKTYF